MTRPVLIATLPTPTGSGVVAQVAAAAAAGIDALLIEDRGTDPGILAAALAVHARGIGLVPTVRTAHVAPYHLARTLATVDHLSGGWSGWAPTGPDDDRAAGAFTGAPAEASDLQRARMAEFAQVVTGLWDSFADDAFVRDRASGLYFHLDRLRAPDHRGEHYTVAGPLNIARPPQGHPVLVRAVRSPDDVEFAVTAADIAIVTTATEPLVREAVRGRAPLIVLEVEAGDGPPPEVGDCDGLALRPPAGPPDTAFGRLLATAAALTEHDSQPRAATSLRDRLGLSRPVNRLLPA